VSTPRTGAAAQSVADKLGIGTPQTVLNWVRKAQVDAGQRPGVTSAEAAELRRLRAEVKQPRLANDILKTASAFFAAAELDRRFG
jgi:transposase